MSIQTWLRWPRYPLALFLGTILAFLVGLGWMGWNAVNGNDAARTATRNERVREFLEKSNKDISAEIRLVISEFDNHLTRLTVVPAADLDRAAAEFGNTLGDDAVLAIFQPDRVHVYPRGRLLYYPTLPPPPELDFESFMLGDVYENQQKDFDRAIEYFRGLAESEQHPGLRGAALLRVARNQRRGRTDAALATYRELAGLGDVWIGSGPADLVARRARCSLLEEKGRRAELASEAVELARDLNAGRWKLTTDEYVFYTGEITDWLAGTPDAAAAHPSPQAGSLTEVVNTSWQQWSNNKPTLGPTSRELIERTMFVLSGGTSERFIVLAGGPGFLQNRLIAPLQDRLDEGGLGMALLDGDDREIVSYQFAPRPTDMKSTALSKQQARLPWKVQVSTNPEDNPLVAPSLPPEVLIVAVGLLAVLVVAGSYFTVRGFTRELEAARLQSDFVAAVSHEFRTPLTMLRQFSDLLVEGRVSSDEERQKYYGAIRRGTRRLTRLVEDLLDFGRMEAGSHKFRLEPLSVKGWLEGLTAEFQEENRSQGVQVEVSWTGDREAEVRADRAALGRAVWNLLDNAVKYSPNSRMVWVDASAEPHQLTVSVRDRGIGVPPHEQKVIFRKFVRGQTADAHVVKGTGLGLALVDQIVGAHGGRVLLESRVGEGSTFSIVLPVHV